MKVWFKTINLCNDAKLMKFSHFWIIIGLQEPLHFGHLTENSEYIISILNLICPLYEHFLSKILMSFWQVHKEIMCVWTWTCSCYVWAVTESEWELVFCVGFYNRGQLISFYRQELSGDHKTVRCQLISCHRQELSGDHKTVRCPLISCHRQELSGDHKTVRCPLISFHTQELSGDHKTVRCQLISFHRQELSGDHKTATHSHSPDIVTKLTFHRVKLFQRDPDRNLTVCSRMELVTRKPPSGH